MIDDSTYTINFNSISYSDNLSGKNIILMNTNNKWSNINNFQMLLPIKQKYKPWKYLLERKCGLYRIKIFEFIILLNYF